MSMGGTPLNGVNIWAVVSLIASVVFAPAGIVLGIIALREIKVSGERGRELAIAGIGIGAGVTLLALLVVAGAVGLIVWSFSILEGLPR